MKHRNCGPETERPHATALTSHLATTPALLLPVVTQHSLGLASPTKCQR